MNRSAIVVGLGIAVAWAGLTTLAGPVTPPAGPIGSSGKTMQDVYDKAAGVESRIAVNAVNTPASAFAAFKISQPGSYYLASNITGVAAKHGIEIASSGVSLNLNGFELLGVPGAFSGVIVSVTASSNIAILNGSIRSWPMRGVDTMTFSATNCRLSGLLASSNGQAGLRVYTASEVARCECSGNGGEGVSAYSSCTISGCTVSANAFGGIVVSSGSTITGCTASHNPGDGFAIGSGSVASDCISYTNGGNGFSAQSGSTISRCTSYSNTGHGISVTYYCMVLANTCTYNASTASDGAGIYCDFGGNHVEGNTCGLARRGVQINSAGNIIIRNTCSGNTTANWTIAAGNVFGPIIDRTAPASAAFSGNAQAGSLGTTDPNANFTY